MKHVVKMFAAAGAITLALTGCGGAMPRRCRLQGLRISDSGGWDDKSFNESAYNGLQTAHANLGVKINTAESTSDADFRPNVETMVADNCNLIIGVGFSWRRPCTRRRTRIRTCTLLWSTPALAIRRMSR